MKKAALSFTGGKDCLLALSEVHGKEVDVTVLVTFGPPEAFLEEEEEGEEGASDSDKTETKEKKKKKKTFLAHPLRVIKMQARALGLPHVVLPIQGQNYLESYAVSEERGMKGRKEGEAHGPNLLIVRCFLSLTMSLTSAPQSSLLPSLPPSLPPLRTRYVFSCPPTR